MIFFYQSCCNREQLKPLISGHSCIDNLLHCVGLHFQTCISSILLSTLIYLGAPVTYSISNNWQPLHEAAKSNEVQILQLLMENGAKINNPVTG